MRKKKTACIITQYGDNNFGNRLQNYAVQELLKKFDLKVLTIRLYFDRKYFLDKLIKGIIRPFISKRYFRFYLFNRFMTIRYYVEKPRKKADYYFSGSDQVWSPYYDGLKFCNLSFADPKSRNSIAASIGTSWVPANLLDLYEPIKDFNKISVREERAKEIIEEITGRTDVEILLDPTMLLEAEEWEKVMKKPSKLKRNSRYVITYFLGGSPEAYMNLIKKYAKENNCEIINVLDKKSYYYNIGPSEFLYLIKNAFAVFGDSFHMCAFSIVFQKPFAIFERNNMVGLMNSRIETLFSKFNISKEFLNGSKTITDEMTKVDYSEVRRIIDEEREKAIKFIEGCLID